MMHGIRAPAIGCGANDMNRKELHMSKHFIFNLQRFAEGEGAEGGGQNTDPQGGAQGKPDEAAEKAKQEEIARAVAAAKAEWEKEAAKKAKAEKKEQERLAKLSEDERKAAELDASKKELEEKAAELMRKELKLDAVKILAEKKLPVALVDALIGADSAATLENINNFEKGFQKAVEAAVNEKLKGKAPNAGGGAGGEGLVKNGFFAAIEKNQVKRN